MTVTELKRLQELVEKKDYSHDKKGTQIQSKTIGKNQR